MSTRFFKLGTVNVTNGNDLVTGTGTSFVNAIDAIGLGDIFTLDYSTIYEVAEIINDTTIRLDRNYTGSTQSSVNYAIIRHGSASDISKLSLQITYILNTFQDFIDQSITYLTSENDTETLTDRHGNSIVLDTVYKAQQDFAAVQAQAESLVGSIVLPTKADFEARHEGKYAGAGFVEMGKHYTDGNWDTVNDGVWCPSTTGATTTNYPNVNTLWLGRSTTDTSSTGTSKTPFPIAYLHGCLIKIYATGYTGRNLFKFPPAPTGLEKADGSGVYSSHAEAVADGFNVVLNRQDLAGYEVFDVNITQTGLPLYPNGNTQFNGTWAGITLANNLVAQGYSAYYVGDTATNGSGFLPDLTNDNHIKFMQDKWNNCYTDNGDIIQRQYRARTIAGLEGDGWIRTTADAGIHDGARLAFGNKKVLPQGISTTPTAFDDTNSFAVPEYINPNTPELGKYHAYPASFASTVAHNGNIWFIPMFLVQRRNGGIFHQVYNFSGSGRMPSTTVNNREKWTSSSTVDITATEQCFGKVSDHPEFTFYSQFHTDNAWMSHGGSVSANLSGRDDGKLYDVIYASDVLDLRLSAHKVNAEVTADNDARKGIGGTKRGWEAQPFTVTNKNYVDGVFKITGVALYNGLSNGHDRIQIPIDTTLAPNIYETISIFPSNHLQRNKVWVVGDNGNVMDAFGFNHLRHADGNCYMWTGYRSSRGNRVNEFNSKFPVGTTLTFIIENHVDYYQAEPTWTDIIADPDVLVATFPDGVGGAWIPIIPDGTSKEYPLTKKSIVDLQTLRTDDNGTTWLVESGWTADVSVSNLVNQGAIMPASTRIQLLSYKAKANFTAPSNRLPMLSQPKTVVASNHNYVGHGCLIAQSIFGKVATGVSSWDGLDTCLKINNLKHEIGTGMLPTTIPSVFHEPLTIKNSNNSFAAKYTHFPVNVNGRLGVLWIGQEVKWDTNSASATVVSVNSAYSYEAGKVYRLSHADFRSLEGSYWIFKQNTTNTATQIADSLSSAQDGVNDSSIAEKWDGNGFGDNGTFTVGDNMAVITDDNENSIVRATHLQMTQYLYTEGM